VIIYALLGYFIIAIKIRKLPWQNIQNVLNKDRTEVVGEFKEQTEIAELCGNLPDQF
jgi:casein kinase I family protein HRR25